MDATISAARNKVVASAYDGDTLTILTFRETVAEQVSEFSIFLPPHMSACASMIVEAFNAHMNDGRSIEMKTPARQTAFDIGREIHRLATGAQGGEITIVADPDDAAMRHVENLDDQL